MLYAVPSWSVESSVPEKCSRRNRPRGPQQSTPVHLRQHARPPGRDNMRPRSEREASHSSTVTTIGSAEYRRAAGPNRAAPDRCRPTACAGLVRRPGTVRLASAVGTATSALGSRSSGASAPRLVSQEPVLMSELSLEQPVSGYLRCHRRGLVTCTNTSLAVPGAGRVHSPKARLGRRLAAAGSRL